MKVNPLVYHRIVNFGMIQRLIVQITQPRSAYMFLPLSLSLVIVIIGILIGNVGIGGVLLVPALKYLGDVAIHVAIPACNLSYIVTGAVGAFIYARHGTIDHGMVTRVCLGSLPGAFLGAFLLPFVPALALEAGIALLILFSGIHTLAGRQPEDIHKPAAAGNSLLVIGFLTGVGSALTGTGGPLLLVPILIWLRVPVLIAIGLSQVIQIPIALAATFGNALYGQIDLKLSAGLALALACGSIIGAHLAHAIPADYLKKGVSILMVLVGLFILFRMAGP